MSKMAKDKDRSGVRTYYEDGFVKRAACICVNENETQVLLVSSRREPKRWIVPGGGVEPGEKADMAAIREVREEAGVLGNLGRCLGVFENSERGHRTSVFVLVVTEELDEWDDSRSIGRKRKWFSVEEAVKQLDQHKPVQSSYVSLLLPQVGQTTGKTIVSTSSFDGVKESSPDKLSLDKEELSNGSPDPPGDEQDT